jgi:hypothetical protein
MKNISIPKCFCISVLTLMLSSIAGSLVRKAEGIPTQTPPTGVVEVQWRWHYEGGFPICGQGQTLGGGPSPSQYFRATALSGTESIGPCDPEIPDSHPVFTSNFVSCGECGYDANALQPCLDSYYGTCSYFPGQLRLSAFVTSDVPFWISIRQNLPDDRGRSQTEPVYSAWCVFWRGYDVCVGLRFSRSRVDFFGDGNIDGEDLATLLNGWGGGGRMDLDGSGRTDGADLAILLNAWGPCP